MVYNPIPLQRLFCFLLRRTSSEIEPRLHLSAIGRRSPSRSTATVVYPTTHHQYLWCSVARPLLTCSSRASVVDPGLWKLSIETTVVNELFDA